MTNEELIEKVQEHLFGLKWAIDVYGDHVAPTPFGGLQGFRSPRSGLDVELLLHCISR